MEDEVEDIRSLYSSDSLQIQSESGMCQISLDVWPCPLVTFRMIFPKTYPREVPVVLLECESPLFSDEIRARVDTALQEVWEDSVGEPCAIAFIECVRCELGQNETLELALAKQNEATAVAAHDDDQDEGDHRTEATVATMDNSAASKDAVSGRGEWIFHPAYPKYGQRPVHFKESSIDERHRVEIMSGETLTDRKSTFQAHLAIVQGDEQVQWAKRHLLENGKIARATHNMIAYRYWDEARGVQVADNDDDGEDGAGSKMAGLLELMGVQNAFIMVSRWYGGIKLGPDRFKHIATTTQKILNDNGFVRNQKNSKKKR